MTGRGLKTGEAWLVRGSSHRWGSGRVHYARRAYAGDTAPRCSDKHMHGVVEKGQREAVTCLLCKKGVMPR